MIFFRTLPGDAKLFTAVDKSWKDIMRRVEDRRNALKAATTTGTLETLTSCRQNLEKIQKSLEVGSGFIDTSPKSCRVSAYICTAHWGLTS